MSGGLRIIKGFTLIEMLIAIVLIVVGLATLMGTMSVGMCADASLEYRLTALNLANEKMEELKDAAFGSIVVGSETGSAIGFDWVDQRIVSVDEPYGPNLLKDVTVTVQWTQKGSTQSVDVETFIAQY
ncbi:MAG: prepilin-type N-terminal cleavage/methylation domain-containing protein [Sedimentisphaerales bacterium]|nr:prepilin-type N-terminal cleavage/methylation domain-containing protein [Sedimentisphaerales bacterium]